MKKQISRQQRKAKTNKTKNVKKSKKSNKSLTRKNLLKGGQSYSGWGQKKMNEAHGNIRNRNLTQGATTFIPSGKLASRFYAKQAANAAAKQGAAASYIPKL